MRSKEWKHRFHNSPSLQVCFLKLQGLFVCWLVGCLTSQQQDSVSQGRICSDNFTCCHTEIEVADQTLYLTQSQYTDTGPTSPSADPITPGAWQGSHWYDSTPKKSLHKRDSNPGYSALEADALPLGQRDGPETSGRTVEAHTYTHIHKHSYTVVYDKLNCQQIEAASNDRQRLCFSFRAVYLDYEDKRALIRITC